MTWLRRIIAGKGDLTTDAWGTQKVVQDISIIQGLFTFDVPPSQWHVSENGVEIPTLTSTRATSITGRLNATSGNTPGDVLHLESRRHPKYQPNRGIKWAASIGFKDASLDGILRAGFIVEEETGIYFKTIGDGSLYACVRRAGVETHAELITFPFTIDITKGNIYDIQMQWRGVGDIKFFAGDPATGLLVLVHTIKFLGTLDEGLSVNNPALSAGFHAENVSQEVSLWCGCVDVTVEGGNRQPEQYGAITSTVTVSSGAGILAVKSPLLIAGKPNTRDVSIARMVIASDRKVTVKAYRTRDPAAITGGTFATFLTGSYMEKNDTMTAVNTALMEEFASFKVPAGGTISKDNPAIDVIDFFMVHGDYIVLVCEIGSIAEIDATIEWGEEI